MPLDMSQLSTAEIVRSIVDYDPSTGIFRWRYRSDRSKAWNTRRAGQIAGDAVPGRRRYITINGRRHVAARLAWLIVFGVWPEGEIDHKNRDFCDDRIDNLRDATHAQNSRNRDAPADNTSGHKGVTWFARDRVWIAQIGVAGKNIYLGRFNTADAAGAAYRQAEKVYFGEFARGDF